VVSLKTLKSLTVISTIVLAMLVSSEAMTDSTTVKQQASIDEPAPGFTLVDIGGKEHTLSAYKGKYVVLEWSNWDCPFVKKHYSSDNMQNLQKQYGDKKVVWLTICSSAPGKQGYYDADDHKKRYDKSGSEAAAYLIDADGAVGRSYGAKTTPHMFVIDPDGVLVYAGAIDDKKSTNAADIEGSKNYVAASLDAATMGNPVPLKTSTPYGCSIKYK